MVELKLGASSDQVRRVLAAEKARKPQRLYASPLGRRLASEGGSRRAPPDARGVKRCASGQLGRGRCVHGPPRLLLKLANSRGMNFSSVLMARAERASSRGSWKN
mmetsp:Transcript_6266/g.23573  ORF Transcript_6266/g.23573 Transcript_6266/m.23573 type:complete len:105 (-) Transcript_6266:817-1131(-)